MFNVRAKIINLILNLLNLLKLHAPSSPLRSAKTTWYIHPLGQRNNFRWSWICSELGETMKRLKQKMLFGLNLEETST